MEKLAIIGTGISGMSAAYFLKDKFEIKVFEKLNYIGGHTNTVEHVGVPIDTGFIVFNEITYPNLVKLFKKLKVEYVDSDMSFAVSDPWGNLEYCGSGLAGLFGQLSNIFRPSFWKMLLDINDFNKNSLEVLNDAFYKNMTISDYLSHKKYSKMMRDKYLLPCASAIWSTSPSKILDFPIVTLVHFFKNHGLLGLNTHFKWKTVKGGSREYRNKLIASFKDKIQIENEVESVYEQDGKYIVQTKNGQEVFDRVVFACHADQTFKILKNKTQLENDTLCHFKYEHNVAQLHTDQTVMPLRKNIWSSWNYLITQNSSNRSVTTYYMNKLQPLNTSTDYFVTLNAVDVVNKEKVVKQIDYEHPLFDLNAINAQKNFNNLNNQKNNRYFCGAYFRYGFHEDGIWSSIQMCESILGEKINL